MLSQAQYLEAAIASTEWSQDVRQFGTAPGTYAGEQPDELRWNLGRIERMSHAAHNKEGLRAFLFRFAPAATTDIVASARPPILQVC